MLFFKEKNPRTLKLYIFGLIIDKIIKNNIQEWLIDPVDHIWDLKVNKNIYLRFRIILLLIHISVFKLFNYFITSFIKNNI